MIHISTVLLIIIAVLLFELLIFGHEFGHFITAKLSGIQVNEFALGMGPKILGFKKGDTQYSLRLFPIGGYCMMEGEDGDSLNERAFCNKPVFKRMIVVIAGAVMNIIIGFILMLILQAQETHYATMTVAKFAEESVSQEAGLQLGDEIYSINGYRTRTYLDMSVALTMTDTTAPEFAVRRNGEIIGLGNVQLKTVETTEGQQMIQLDFYLQSQERTIGSALSYSVKNTVSVVKMVWQSLIGLLTGKFGFNDMSGIVGTANVIKDAAAEGLKTSFGDAVNNIIYLIMIISVNLGVFNMLPIPALDGGRFLFLIIEAVRRKPMNRNVEGWINTIFFGLLLLLIIIVTCSDVIKIFR